MADSLLQHVELMTRGKVATERHFACPACGGQAHVQAERSGSGVPGPLRLSAWCDGCRARLEAQGVAEWPGWQVLTAPD